MARKGRCLLNVKRNHGYSVLLRALVLQSAAGAVLSCSAGSEGTAGTDEIGEVDELSSNLTPAEDAAVARTRAPIRALEVPGNVYMTSIEQTSSATGSFAHVVHVYQPDANNEGIRFEVAARTSGGVVDTAHTFQTVRLVSRPGEPDQTTTSLANSSGQRVYSVATSRQGWYRFSLVHGAPSGGRTLTLKAYDAAGNPLKMAWSDPPGTNAQVRVRFNVAQPTNLFFKGGAYRNADSASSAFVDSVRVNGSLLYRRGFDQGRFNFPLGSLNAGQHTLDFSLNATGGTPKYWFGVNEKSFDALTNKATWDAVQFLYQGPMRTGDYDAWNDGVAFLQGQTVSGSRPPPVRRGTTFAVALSDSSLSAGNATLRIASVMTPQTELNWTKTLPANSDYAGGVFASGSLSGRHREHWQVVVPSNAPVGRYTLSAFTPGGQQIGASVLFYVIHNPYTLLSNGAISKAELETWGYDEDEDGVLLQGPYGADRDNLRDHFTAFYDGNAEWGYTPTTMITGAFRRTQDETFPSMLDIAVASMDGMTNEFDSMLRLYRIVSQRLKYNRPAIPDDSSDSLIGGDTGLDPSLAFWFSLQSTEFSGPLTTGQCFEYGNILAAVARSAGILARPASSWNSLAGWGNHVFTEAYVPGLPHHGGKQTSSGSSANSDNDPWYVFDATDPNGTAVFPRYFTTYSEAVAPRSQFAKAAVVLQGPPAQPFDVVTNPVTWDPLATATVPASGVLNLSAAYNSGPEFWLTASGVSGWVGYGEKDVYRINKAATGARAVRVSIAPGGSYGLDLKLCVGSASNVPVMPSRCDNAAVSQVLPDGDSYVVVFNDAEDMPARYLRGDVAKYVLDLEY